ncbi:hypothetical protein [Avibacterium paragallinarum]|uniref:hypothetical protein n=1 Tax=Avibacterium paragallinarum TaxID=728 RepID=UPI0003789366|nr:hypothetical protein [Avibacterium paragallinarum]
MKEISKKECYLYQFRGGGGGGEIFMFFWVKKGSLLKKAVMFFCDKEGIFIKNVSFYTKENSLTH